MAADRQHVTVRRLGADDWQAYRSLRLQALRSNPGVFFAPYAREAALERDDWRGRLENAANCRFGLYDGNDLIGITGVVTDQNDPSERTALLVASYLVPSHRGMGLAARLFSARLAWIRHESRFTRVVVSHRASNEPSGRAIRAAGFSEVGRASREWPDGITDDEIMYELNLQRE